MSKNRTGKNVKTVYVYSNDRDKTIRKLHISVEVLARDEDIEKS